MSTIEYKILDKLAKADKKQDLILEALHYLLVRNSVIGTSDYAWVDHWRARMIDVAFPVKSK